MQFVGSIFSYDRVILYLCDAIPYKYEIRNLVDINIYLKIIRQQRAVALCMAKVGSQKGSSFYPYVDVRQAFRRRYIRVSTYPRKKFPSHRI